MEERLLKERRLYIRVLKGDTSALGKIKDLYRRTMLRAARKSLIDQSEADWVVDMVFFHLARPDEDHHAYLDPEHYLSIYFDLEEFLLKKVQQKVLIYNRFREKPIDKAALNYLKKCYPHADLTN